MTTRTAHSEIKALVSKYGIREVLLALSRDCKEREMPLLFRRLERAYNWLVYRD